MIVPAAHAGHWLIGLGFASAPLTVVAAIGVLAWRERRGSSQPARDTLPTPELRRYPSTPRTDSAAVRSWRR